MVNVGIAGIGFMGWIHWLAYLRTPGAQVTAIFSRNPAKLAGDWTGIKGNFGPEGGPVDLSGVQAFASLEAMLADPSINVVDICLPPHLHEEAVRKALEAGKHVFCEKPLTVDPESAEQLVKVSAHANRQLLVGHVLPFFPEFAFARRLAADGKHGRLLGGYFKRVISDPLWLENFYDPQLTGGPLLDLHVHDAHFIRLLFGMPSSVASVGRMRGDVVEHCQTIFEFDDPTLSVAASCGVINQQGRPFTHGFELHLEQATLQFEFAAFSDLAETMPLKVLHQDGRVERPELGDGDPVLAFCDEINEMVRSIESGVQSEVLSGELARDAIILCQRQSESVRRRNPVAV